MTTHKKYPYWIGTCRTCGEPNDLHQNQLYCRDCGKQIVCAHTLDHLNRPVSRCTCRDAA